MSRKPAGALAEGEAGPTNRSPEPLRPASP
jgi:hypothetical protein